MDFCDIWWQNDIFSLNGNRDYSLKSLKGNMSITLVQRSFLLSAGLSVYQLKIIKENSTGAGNETPISVNLSLWAESTTFWMILK